MPMSPEPAAGSGVALLDLIDAEQVPLDLPAALRELPGASVMPGLRTRYNLACHAAGRGDAPDVALRILGEDTTRSSHPGWVARDPSLRGLRLHHAATFRRAIRLGRIPVPGGPAGGDPGELVLERLDSIGFDGASVLGRVGIGTPLGLLAAAGATAQRKALAASTGLTDTTLERWAYLAELGLSLTDPSALPPPPIAPAAPAPAETILVFGSDGIVALSANEPPMPPAPAGMPTDTPGSPVSLAERLDAVNLLAAAGIAERSDLATWAGEEGALVARVDAAIDSDPTLRWPAACPLPSRRALVGGWIARAAVPRGSWVEATPDTTPPASSASTAAP
jgi:hypothetical protein